MQNSVEELTNLNTKQRIPLSIRKTVFEVILEAISDELLEFRKDIYNKNLSFYDIDVMDKSRMQDLCTLVKVPLITLIQSNTRYLQEEIRAIPFKILHKGTPTLYKSFSLAINRNSELFLYRYVENIKNITRIANNPLINAQNTHRGLPFRHSSSNDFSGIIEKVLLLDSDPINYLDSNTAIWTLDASISEISTNHIGLEYFIDRIIKKDNKNFLLTASYFDYLNINFEFGRRAKEIPHIGAQLSIQIDDSGLCNSIDHVYADCSEGSNESLCLNCEFIKIVDDLQQENNQKIDYTKCYYKNGGINSCYTVPSIKLKAVTCSNYFDKVQSSKDLAEVVFGIETHEIASVENPTIPFPENLKKIVFSASIWDNDKFENNNYIGAVAEYKGQSLNNEIVTLIEGEFNNENQYFLFLLEFTPIRKNNIILTFYLPDEKIFTITDNGQGKFISPYAQGTINYETGLCELTTQFKYVQERIIQVEIPPGHEDITFNRTLFSYQLLDNPAIGKDNIIRGSVWLTFYIKDNFGEKVYLVKDNENGRFVHEKIDDLDNTINYETSKIFIRFKSPLTEDKKENFICKFEILVDFRFPIGTKLAVSYFTRRTILITEAGFKNREGELVSYATFPPIEFNSNAYHLNFMLLVRKPCLHLSETKGVFIQIPTCTTPGLQEIICINCKKVLRTDTTPINPENHIWYLSNNIPATCEEPEKEYWKCINCDTVDPRRNPRQVGSALGHDYSLWEQTSSSTCDNAAVETEKCLRCGEFGIKTRSGQPALGHEFNVFISSVPATCLSQGYDIYKCSRCNVTKEYLIPALGHDWGDYFQTTLPTCTEAGIMTRCCTRDNCSAIDVTTIIGDTSLGHDTNGDEATCLNPKLCLRCGTILATALGHEWSDGVCLRCDELCTHQWSSWLLKKEATCTEDGEYEKTCSICGKTEINSISALGHNFINNICTLCGLKLVTSPYASVNWNWSQYKTVLHVHTTNSDGINTLAEVVEKHYELGFDILAITDHNNPHIDREDPRRVPNTPTWLLENNVIIPGDDEEDTLARRSNFGLSESRLQEIKLGVDRNNRGLLPILFSAEWKAGVNAEEINVFFTDHDAWNGWRTWGDDPINYIVQCQNNNGICIINHPGRATQQNFSNIHEIQRYASYFLSYSSLVGMEIVNSTDHETYNDRLLWDNILKETITENRFVWGFANDDSHNNNSINYSFNMLILPENTEQAFKNALQNGHFYAVAKVARYEGVYNYDRNNNDIPVITSISTNEDKIIINAENFESIQWIYDSQVLYTGTEFSTKHFDDPYIRAVVIGQNAILFTQPFKIG